MTFINPDIESSYQRSAIGKILYNTIISTGATKIIDFGLLNGHSTICLAMAAKITGGIVYGYDIFEDYEYNNSSRDIVLSNLKRYNVDDYVVLKRMDFNDWVKEPEDFDVLHVDISNDGDIISSLHRATGHLNSIVLFEGGSEERDQQDWMKKYNKKPICDIKDKYKLLSKSSYKKNNRMYYPSISVLINDAHKNMGTQINWRIV